MTRVLVTGMSGTGKSSAVARLAALGYAAVDADEPGWSHWALVRPPGASVDTEPVLDWVWREDRMAALLAAPRSAALFVAGCAANQGLFRDRFDRVVLLSAPPEVMLARVATRTTNDFGKDADERAKILADRHAFEPMLRAAADEEIDTGMLPLDAVVARLIEVATAPR